MIRPAGRPFATGVLTAAVLVAVVAFCRPTVPAEAPDVDAPRSGSPASIVTLVQMNLCLSGMAGCFDAAGYPGIIDETVLRIRAVEPDAVTVNEACRLDAVEIGRRTGYQVRFVPVRYAGALLPCVDPGGRGLFGLAVLTKEPVVGSDSDVFRAQAELEERRWLCVSTVDGVDVCTAHLEAPDARDAAAANEGQCAELARVLADRESRSVLFGGDLNRRGTCAPAGAWSRTDAASDRLPGVQHVYGSPAFDDPVAQVVAWPFSDHDLLVVSAGRTAPGRRGRSSGRRGRAGTGARRRSP